MRVHAVPVHDADGPPQKLIVAIRDVTAEALQQQFCGWPSGTPRRDWDGPTARFGFAGSIGDEATCQAAGGYWIPLALGWMTHIYPNETERDKIWIGEQMMTLNAAEVQHNAHKQQMH